MATHSSVLAWRIPGMGKPGGLPSMGSHRVRHRLKRLSSSSTGVYAATIFIIHHYLAKVYAIAKSSVKTSPSSH